MKKLIATSLLSAAVGATGAAVFVASDSGAFSSRPSIDAATADDEGTTETDPGETGDCDGAGRGGRRHRLIRAAIGTVIETIGISAEEFRAEMADGGSIADVAEAHGVDPATVEAALLDALEARIAEAVERGRLDPERATEILDGAAERIHDFVTKDRPARPESESTEATAAA